MRGRRHRAGEIPQPQAVIVGANVRVLRQRNGWPQAKLGEPMGWLGRRLPGIAAPLNGWSLALSGA